jgi:hypothetical protein
MFLYTLQYTTPVLSKSQCTNKHLLTAYTTIFANQQSVPLGYTTINPTHHNKVQFAFNIGAQTINKTKTHVVSYKK